MVRRIVLVIVLLLLSVGVITVALGEEEPQGGPGSFLVPLVAGQNIPAGNVHIWNSPKVLNVMVEPSDGWRIAAMQVYAGSDPVPNRQGNPVPGKFPFKKEFEHPVPQHKATFDLKDDLNISWGHPDRVRIVAVHVDLVQLDEFGEVSVAEGAWAWFAGRNDFESNSWGGWVTYLLDHPMRGHFIDSPVIGLTYQGPSFFGVTSDEEGGGGFLFFPDEEIEFSVGSVVLGTAEAAKKVDPTDFFDSADTSDPRVINIAWFLQSLDVDGGEDGKIEIVPTVVACLEEVVTGSIDFSKNAVVAGVIEGFRAHCGGLPGTNLDLDLTAAEAQANLETGLNASGIFRKNMSKTEDWGETKQKLEVMPVYFPGLRSNGDPSLCVDEDGDRILDDGDQVGVPYEEWRLNGDPAAAECDPRDFEDPEACKVTLIECRDVAKPILTTYMGKVDIYDDQVKVDFWEEPERFSWDIYTAISRDDGATWKRMNVSRMADMSSFELKTTGEPFPGTTGSPYLKVNDNKILVVWESKFCKSGNPRYSINLCDNPATEEGPIVDPATGEVIECEKYCTGNPDKGTEVCTSDDPNDDAYFQTDIWGVRGQQQSVNYDEVDDVADLGIGEIPYSCLWAARGVIASQKELNEGTFASMTIMDDNDTEDPADDFERAVELGDIVWFKPERITSGRRDVYIPTVDAARGAGFAIAWQEDPSGLRPGKGKGPGEGWSGAISNHKTDIWYSFISYDDFNIVDENFVPSGPGGDDSLPEGDEGYIDKPGLGRPKALVPFSMPVRITDNDMVNTHTLKVEPSDDCPTFPDSTGENADVCFPEVVTNENGVKTFVPMDLSEIEAQICSVDHIPSENDGCCDPDDHEGDPDCEDLKGFFGNLTGTKRYAYMARYIDEKDNATGLYTGGDGLPDYQYYEARGGTLDLCDLSGDNTFMSELPGEFHERWFGFTNAAGSDKLVCVSSDGRLLDGDVFASRPMLKLQPYTRPDGTKSAWALLAYEESKGLGHSLAAAEHEDTDNPVDELIGEPPDDAGQEKPIKQDIGKNLMYHSFDFAQPDLINPGHIVNLPALCGGLYPTYCDDRKTPEIETNDDNPTCTCEAGQPVPLYFDYWSDIDPDGDGPLTGQWLPDDEQFLQYRTEIARRARFIVQSPGKMGATKTLGAIIYKQGQEGQGRPADAFIRRFVKRQGDTGNPYKFENLECTTYLDETFDLPSCPNDVNGIKGYNCNVWGEPTGDRLCGGIIDVKDPAGSLLYTKRDHINLTSADVDLAVGVGPDADGDPTTDVYSRNKVLLWSQHESNLGDESYGLVHADGTACDVLNSEVCPGMYSNVRSHRGFIRGDFLSVAYALSPNWAAARNGNDRYNFYVRRSFDGGQTWTTTPADLGGAGVYVCPEYRTDPYRVDETNDYKHPDVFDSMYENCGTFDPVYAGEDLPEPVGIAMTNYLDPLGNNVDNVQGQYIAAGVFEPARNVSEIMSNHETSADPRLGTTPPTYPLDGTAVGSNGLLKNLCPSGNCVYVEDTYVDNMFFVAWGTADNAKSTGGDSLKTEASPLDLYYTRSEDYGDTYFKVPWRINSEKGNLEQNSYVWRYEHVAKGEPEEQGEAQLRATSDGSKAYVIWHSSIPVEDPDEIPSRWYPWKPSKSTENDLWFRRLIFWPDAVTTP